MEHPQTGLLPDSPVSDITVERVTEILTEQGLNFRVEDSEGSEAIIRTGFSNTAIAIQLRDKFLVVDSVWRGRIPTSQGPQLLSLVNQWNAEHFAPTMRFFEAGTPGENGLAVSAVRELLVAPGASRNQLGAFLVTSLNSLLEAYAFIESAYPQLVTWRDEHNEH